MLASLNTESGEKLFRIKALRDFGSVRAGGLGGLIEKEENLDQAGNAWVSGEARVSEDAQVRGDAQVTEDAEVCGNADYVTVKGFGRVYRTTTFFRERAGSVGVKCGCFYGTLDEFRKKVEETHGKSRKGKEYQMLADLMEYRFSHERN